MKVELENVKPMDIEKRSFEIITEELGDTPLLPGTELVVRFTALCQMRMWRRLRKKMVPPVPQQAWTRRPGWIKS